MVTVAAQLLAAIPAVPATPAVRAGATCDPAPKAGLQMSTGLPTPPGHVAGTGVLRALTLMIDFPDAPGAGSARARFGEFFPRTAEWYRTSSYGALDYRAETPVKGWLRMPQPFASYGIGRGVAYEPGYRRLIRDIAAAADPHVDFRPFHLVNVLVTPNAGPSALDTVLSVTFAGTRDAPIADGVPLAHVSFVYSRQDDGSPTGAQHAYRVLPHENAHAFGLPDLYTPTGGTKVGHWDIMSEDWGDNNDFLGWHKRKLGWLRQDQFHCASGVGRSVHTLTPLGRAGGSKLLYLPVSARGGYAVEVRTQEGNDALVCKPGVLVYWVDTWTASGRGPVTVIDSAPRSGGCARRPNVTAELTDAPYGVGERFTDSRRGIAVEVLGRDAAGNHRVAVTRH
ncbi:M6 family metalloprotease domain-containing protein [Streptomyces sp. URMC 123]|uniref:M6 family metalloprotease domain-containing protein n=1 Tax=Streptomyces sp. URMC 123 TaxID=3423403 RepID=UPI003F1E004F